MSVLWHCFQDIQHSARQHVLIFPRTESHWISTQFRGSSIANWRRNSL